MIGVIPAYIMVRVRIVMLAVGSCVVNGHSEVNLPSAFKEVNVTGPFNTCDLIKDQLSGRSALIILQIKSLFSEDFVHRCMTMSDLDVLEIDPVDEPHLQR